MRALINSLWVLYLVVAVVYCAHGHLTDAVAYAALSSASLANARLSEAGKR